MLKNWAKKTQQNATDEPWYSDASTAELWGAVGFASFLYTPTAQWAKNFINSAHSSLLGNVDFDFL